MAGILSWFQPSPRRQEDGRWIADALELSGVMCYGQARGEAISNTERLAIEVSASKARRVLAA
jgi:hypothetical protein